MRIFILFFILLNMVFAAKVEIKADKFSADEMLGQGKFLGNVVISKGNDILRADKLLVDFNKKKKPTKYTANGNVSINIFIKGKNYFGSGNKLIYEPLKNAYRLDGNAFLEDRTTNKKVYGESIYVNQKDGKYEVDSKDNEPVKFIFQIDDGVKWQQ